MVFFILFYKKGCRNSFILFKQGDILIQIQENSDVLKQKKKLPCNECIIFRFVSSNQVKYTNQYVLLETPTRLERTLSLSIMSYSV